MSRIIVLSQAEFLWIVATSTSHFPMWPSDMIAALCVHCTAEQGQMTHGPQDDDASCEEQYPCIRA